MLEISARGWLKKRKWVFLSEGKQNPEISKSRKIKFCENLPSNIIWFLFFLYQHFLSLRFFFGFIAIVDVSLAQLPMAMLLWNWNLKLDFTLFLIYAFVCSPFSVCSFLIQIFLPFTCSSLCDVLLLKISFAEHGLCSYVSF